jgi:hypothetical protein
MAFPSRCGLLTLVLSLSFTSAHGQVPAPPKPDSYRATIRYRIVADRDGRVLQYREMLAHLKANGFVPTPKEDDHLDAFDPVADRLEGTISSSSAKKLLDDPRVLTVLLEPANAAAGADTVQMEAMLAGGLQLEQQRQLHSQAVARLGKLGFRENVGYDHRGYTRIRGAIPGNIVPSLVKDLRGLPAGWFAPAASQSELPLPIRGINPLRIIEVLATAPDAFGTIAVEVGKGKLGADLMKWLADPAVKDKPARVEVLLDDLPVGGLRELADRFALVAETASLEGFTGQAAVVRLEKSQYINELTRLPEVRHIRTLRAMTETVRPGASDDSPNWTVAAGIDRLHARGYRGAGVKVVVVATGFPGRAAAASPVLDLTAELSPSLDSMAADPRHPGAGTDTERAIRLAAPSAEIVAVRIDPYAFHQLGTIARAVTGLPGSDALRSRLAELTRQSAVLGERRKVVMEEYSAALRNISDDEKPLKRREAAKKAYDELRNDEAAFTVRFERYRVLQAGLQSLGNAAVVVNTVVSEVGHPYDGLSELNRIIEEKYAAKPLRSAIRPDENPPRPVWVQAAGDAVGTIWAGPFADADGNGVMEFAPEAMKGQWTPELNFLTFRGTDGTTSADIPAGRFLRVNVQWREPVDRAAGLTYSQFPLTLSLLRQIDPSGKTAAADEMIEIARTGEAPVRIDMTATSAVYEQTLTIALPKSGRHALRVAGRSTSSKRGQPIQFEVTPRIVLDAGDAGTAAAGRFEFESVAPALVGVGIPGESTNVTTVGVRGSQTGAGPGLTLLAKPNLYAPASVAGGSVRGSAIAAGYAGGVLACLAEAGMRPRNLPRALGLTLGSDLKFTDEFLQSLPKR